MAKTSKSKVFVADPAKGLHPDTNKPRVEEIKVLASHESPSRVGFGGPATVPPRGKTKPHSAGSPETHPLAKGGPTAKASMAAPDAAPKKVAPRAKKAAKSKIV
jgi:hypothetical protein